MYPNNSVILNCLPPAETSSPSIALSSLQTYLLNEGVNSKILYWNLQLDSIFKEIKIEGNITWELKKLLPFIYLLQDEYENLNDYQDFENIFQVIYPLYKYTSKDFRDYVARSKHDIQKSVQEALSRINPEEVKLFGFTSKIYQWIPAVYLCRVLKKTYPNLKTVIGGFSNKSASVEIMKTFECFDFAIWGEGEIPLYQLHGKYDDTDSFESIPRLVFRNNGRVETSKINTSFTEINRNTIMFDDYFSNPKILSQLKGGSNGISILLNKTRGCSWNKCKFCVLNQGYKYRETAPELMMEVIDKYFKKYRVKKFQFVDNDIIGKDIKQFERFLDLIIKYSDIEGSSLEIFGEIIHKGYDCHLIKKMRMAGIRSVQIGFEALTDELLAKMNKKTSFADSIFFLKFATKYGIKVDGANIIRGIPDERMEDIYESIKNLHFLRFFIGKNKTQLQESNLCISKGSIYYSKCTKEEREKYISNHIYSLFPKHGVKLENRFNLFEFSKKNEPNEYAWNKFTLVHEYYNKNTSDYKLYRSPEGISYIETHNGELVNKIDFDKPVYWDILSAANNKVISFDQLKAGMQTKNHSHTDETLKQLLHELKDEYLLYFKKDYSMIISIPDTEIVI